MRSSKRLILRHFRERALTVGKIVLTAGFDMILNHMNSIGNPMQNRSEHERLKSDLVLPWLIVAILFALLAGYVVICHLFGEQFKQHLPESQREVLRTVFYAAAIIIFPLTNLIRHIMVRLNQTMPGATPPKQRYLTTIIVSMSLVESVGVMGLGLFILGDDFNTLYIFSGLALLGLFLYRPKPDEYLSIVDKLSARP
jgi:hypothetical protein